MGRVKQSPPVSLVDELFAWLDVGMELLPRVRDELRRGDLSLSSRFEDELFALADRLELKVAYVVEVADRRDALRGGEVVADAG